MSNLMSWALKRALRVLIIVCASRRLLRIVRLIRRPIILNIIVSAALREVSAAERFRRGLEELRTLLDSDPRLQLGCHYPLTWMALGPHYPLDTPSAQNFPHR